MAYYQFFLCYSSTLGVTGSPYFWFGLIKHTGTYRHPLPYLKSMLPQLFTWKSSIFAMLMHER